MIIKHGAHRNRLYFYIMDIEKQRVSRKTEELKQRYKEVRAYSVALASPLNTEDYVPQTVPFASPPKWHLAHITWFFEEFILKAQMASYTVFNDSYAFLFNSYYNTIGERTYRADRGNITRPSVEEVYAYRNHVDEHMTAFLEGDLSQEVADLLEIGLNHEQQHQELFLTDLKYMFGHNPTFPVYDADAQRVEDYNTESGWLAVTEGVYDIGHQNSEFCYDNELGAHKVYLHDCEISKTLVTNEEYVAFMDDGAYTRFEYWLDEGWSWVNEHKVDSPLFWHKIDGVWHYYTLGGLRPVDPKAILSHVSYYEANAFATWKGMRLPTEFEWEVASKNLNWGSRWEWTASAYLPYPGFKIAAGALGEYNGKFMVNQMVLRGASVATSSGHSRATYRNFFHPHFQWQFSGIRLAK